MMKTRKFNLRGLLLTSAFFILIVLSSVTYSISLGSFPPSKKLVELDPGKSTKIKIGFFNPGSEDIYLSVFLLTRIASSSYGPDLKVYFVDDTGRLFSSIVLPKSSTTTSPTPEKEWYLLPDGRTYIEVKPVYVLIEVPNKPTFARNHYRLLISARASSVGLSDHSASRSGIYQTLAQERQYSIDVIIRGVVPVGEVNIAQEAEMVNPTPLGNNTAKILKDNGKPSKKKIQLDENDKYFNPTYYLGNENKNNDSNKVGSESITGKLERNVSRINKTTVLIIILGILGVIYVMRM